jgi:hypothetical protein
VATDDDDVNKPDNVPDCVDQDAHDQDIAEINRRWAFLAGVAWAGFSRVGRGVVVIDLSSNAEEEVTFAGGATPCDCHAHLVRDYEPEREVVIAVLRGDDERVYVVANQPPPPEAFARSAAEILKAEVR